jgi:hypothetical protein
LAFHTVFHRQGLNFISHLPTKTKPQRGEKTPINGTYTKRGCRNATALQRLGCRAVVPRQPQIIQFSIANADIHGFRIANSEELGYSALRTKRTE